MEAALLFACIAVFLQSWYDGSMTKVISVNQRGALTLPKEVREKLGVTHGGQLVVDFDEAGEVVLRAGVVMPVEIYSNARAKEFEQMNEKPLAAKKLRWRKAE
jgi:AbrB family looped-hinge helix DNA binding protein